MKMSVEYWWNDTDRAKQKYVYRETNLSQCLFVHHKYHMHWLEWNPVLRGESHQVNVSTYLRFKFVPDSKYRFAVWAGYTAVQSNECLIDTWLRRHVPTVHIPSSVLDLKSERSRKLQTEPITNICVQSGHTHTHTTAGHHHHHHHHHLHHSFKRFCTFIMYF